MRRICSCSRALNEAGCEFVFSKKVCGARAQRSDLDACAAALQPANTLAFGWIV